MNYLKKRDLIIPSGCVGFWGVFEDQIFSSKIINGTTVYQLGNNPSWYLYQREAYDSGNIEYVLHNIPQAGAAQGSIGRKLKIIFPSPYGETCHAYFHPFPVSSGASFFGYLKTDGNTPKYIWRTATGYSSKLIISHGLSIGTRYNYDNTSDIFYYYNDGWKYPALSVEGSFIPANIIITAEDDDAYKLTHGTFPVGVYKNRNDKEALIGFVEWNLKLKGNTPYNTEAPMINYASYPSERILPMEDQVPTITARPSFANGLSVYMDMTNYYDNGQFKASREHFIMQSDLSYWTYTGILPYNEDMEAVTFNRHWAGNGTDPYPFDMTLSFSAYRNHLTTQNTVKLTAYIPIIDNGHWQ